MTDQVQEKRYDHDVRANQIRQARQRVIGATVCQVCYAIDLVIERVLDSQLVMSDEQVLESGYVVLDLQQATTALKTVFSEEYALHQTIAHDEENETEDSQPGFRFSTDFNFPSPFAPRGFSDQNSKPSLDEMLDRVGSILTSILSH